MTCIPRSQITTLEFVAAFVSVGVLIGFAILGLPERLGVPETLKTGWIIAGIDGSLTYLVMIMLLPTWCVVSLEHAHQRHLAEWYAHWWATRHPLMEQRVECALRAAYLARHRGDRAAAYQHAELGLAIAGAGLDRLAISFYYALCLAVRASFFESAGRYQEALEDYARATRLHLKPPALTAQYYAQAAGVLYDLGRFDDAVSFAQQAIAAGSCPPEFLALAHRSAALALAEQERYADAVAQSRAGLDVHPYSWASALLTADHVWLLTMAGDTAEAADYRAKVEAMMQKELIARLIKPEYQEVLARIEFARENWAEAEKLLRESMQQTSHHAAQCYYLMLLTARRGDATQATEWRERLRREYPESFYTRRIQDTAAVFGDAATSGESAG